ncbi:MULTISPECIES: nucleotide sugar dehydrogenase [Kitasatospora]|uniref:UDP-N-acetyl-D-glucosamine dehydrogenase n=2 Tax=Kitasatospora TaxID=2063 RepID=A0ABT1IQB4_9ACTN|nr:nucleotide sugar dehydrogenase [Kitasatospora paracochleata]MCP2307290.1 UDP-N-acetyl-D-glucosamine dehydrogenase [Kitasatospora paracochleata]
MRVVIAGQGYVGLPLAVRAAEVGHRVVGYDVDERRIKRLAVGESYVEDIPGERLRPLLEDGAYLPSADPADVAGFDIAVITVPTPLREGAPDLSYIEASARLLAEHLRPGATVVLESTTYPGTTEELLAPLLEQGSGLTAGRDFHLGYSPERIDPGNPVWKLENTPKVVSGTTPEGLAAVDGFYGQLVERTVPVSSCKEAELTKLLENTFRHVNIALVNELAMFAHDLGIDVWEAIDAASTKPFGFLRFTPGPGVGGHCLPIDPSYLSWRVERALGQSFRFVELANDVNSHMPDYVVRRLVEALNERRLSVNGSRILVLGLAYKKNTGDARETPAARVVELLSRMGADVRAADPHVVAGVHVAEPAVPGIPGQRTAAHDGGPLASVRRVEATPEELAAADAVVLLADHDEFDYDAVVAHSRYVLDCRRRLTGAGVEVL